MRVTTERAQSAIKAHHITGNLTNIVKDYAADLLDSRATIEKQTELIKEMRAKLLIGGIQATSDMKMFRSIPVDSGIISDLIKRTKEYI